ncbi:MAG TPA: molybdopterin guanine dinucleotide-containing S/N-oxide reductase [Alphaproteobacteria bacterium]|jgi:biotin/methionine sulfoxide reductase
MNNRERLTSTHWGAGAVEVKDGRVVAVHPFSRDPHPSPILDGMPDGLYAPTRVARPAIRKGWLEHRGRDGNKGRGTDPFVEVSWDEALDLVAGEVLRVRKDHGSQAIFGGSYGWSSAGAFHHARTQLRRFLFTSGGCVDQVTNYSYAAGMIILPHIIGTNAPIGGPMTTWRSIAKHTNLMVMFGGANLRNMQVYSGGTGEHASESWLRKVHEAGVKFVSITPVRDDSPDFLGAEWLAPKPNSDTAVMLGLAHTLVVEGLHDKGFLATHCVGFDKFLPYLTGETDGVPKSAAWAAGISGLDAATIQDLARRMAKGRTMLAATWSLQRADHGEQPYWMLAVLSAMLGQVGLPGGGFGYGYGSIGGPGVPGPEAGAPRFPTERNPLNFAIPVARVADLLLEPGKTIDFDGKRLTYPDIKMVFWAGGNPFHHHQDINRLVEAFRRPDTVVVNEIAWTSTARHADIVLPATTSIERNDIGASSRDRYVIAMHKHIEPVGEARDDFAIFSALARRIGSFDAFTQGRDEMGWLRHMYEEYRGGIALRDLHVPAFDTFWESGYVELPVPEEDFVLFEAFRRDPEAHPLHTASGKIEIFCEDIAGFGYDDCPGHPTWMPPYEWLDGNDGRHPLHMITNQPKSRLHSQLDPVGVSAASKIAGREPVRLNPGDAAARGVATGDIVEIFNDRGRCLAGAEVSDRLRPGVIQISTGAWYDPADPATPNSLDVHGNPNVLTADRGTSRLGQGPSPLTAMVEVRKYAGEAPAVTVHEPPKMATR